MKFAKPQAIRTRTGRELTGNWLYLNKGLGYITIPDSDRVVYGCECPECHEARVDYLAWQDSPDGEYVECQNCGRWYDPNEED